MRLSHLIPAALWLALAAPQSAGAQPAAPASAMMRPVGVTLHVHQEIADQRFLALLLRRLEATLAAPVTLEVARFDIPPFRGPTRQVEAPVLMESLVRAIDWNAEAGRVHVLLIGSDMRAQPANFNFAFSAGTAATPFHLSIVSLARLQVVAGTGTVDRDPARTAERAFKMIVKNVARVAGYGGSGLCLLGFPRSLAELDALPQSFCEPDVSALTTAGILRAPAR
jgi:predicted Zn-dependent protease